ncbi:uncharacterized protein LOC134178034 [Corticium candelabrum]|uniref:uncharacterized protein LOC134178034 n=1 Tax=Corticium candelabrum TaxID=121492 RepID=UPI002E25B56A|nr:uncharacterized protein LOC134178034 [Corticium candelabrum]
MSVHQHQGQKKMMKKSTTNLSESDDTSEIDHHLETCSDSLPELIDENPCLDDELDASFLDTSILPENSDINSSAGPIPSQNETEVPLHYTRPHPVLQVINFCAHGSSIPAQRTILEDDLEETTTCARVVCDADNILQLLGTACRHPFCQEKISVKQTYVGGTLCLQWHCRNRHEGSWSSSKRCKGRKSYPFFTNDLLFASSIVLSGNQFAKIELMCRFLGLKFQSQSTFYRIQRLYICPSVFELWSETRETNLADIANCPVVLAGDARNDSPGFSAKYCVYSLMDCESHKVVDVQIVDKRDVDLKSMRMEKLGLQRGMTSVRLRINVVELVTDASTSVKAMMARDAEYKEIFHSLDVWHKAKKLAKALSEASKKKELAELRPWKRSIVNHFWWSCAQAQGDVQKLKAI